MIKFFRRIRQNMIKENKVSKYMLYAIGEIVLVVVGILIALSINNWNQQRIENKKELVLLQQLLEDFNANKELIKEGVESYQDDLKKIKVTLHNTGPKVNIPSPTVYDSIEWLDYTTVELVYGTINPTLSSQQIDRLTNDKLKIALTKFPSTLSSYKQSEKSTRDLTLEQRKLHQKYISLLNSDASFTQVHFKSDSLGLLRDRNFQNITVDKKWITNGAINELKALNKSNEQILELIKVELNKYD
ncbi:hypothetical protein JYT89_04250 [Flavobacteriaceae bacterium AH-315-B10]|nr:hypothetical protein [Flavobacteriaceae bacterium AH-315-B10]